MTISVRLDKETEALLREAAGVLHTTRSEVVKRSLQDYCHRIIEERERHPFQLIEDLIDKEGSGRGDLSVRGEEILREAFRRKR
jgi:hypothetical protein